MAKPLTEPLARSRRVSVVAAAAIGAIPLGFVTRGLDDWSSFAIITAYLLVVFGVTLKFVYGPFVRGDGFPEADPPETNSDGSTPRRRSKNKQLVLGSPRSSGQAAARSDH
jgi:hypothetical protein